MYTSVVTDKKKVEKSTVALFEQFYLEKYQNLLLLFWLKYFLVKKTKLIVGINKGGWYTAFNLQYL
jgi:hypothetical protein